MVALVLAILPVVPGFLRAATTPGGRSPNPTFLDTLYTYAWFVTFVLSLGCVSGADGRETEPIDGTPGMGTEAPESKSEAT